MPRYVAFLRAINVGGHIVKMDRLRTLIIDAGFTNVATLIASGNLTFESRARSAALVEQTIEGALQQALGYEVATFVRTPSQVAAVAATWPFGDALPLTAGQTLFVGFLRGAPPADVVSRVEQLTTATDDLRVVGRELYWLRRTAIVGSKLTGARLERVLGGAMTLRNLNTVRRLAPLE